MCTVPINYTCNGFKWLDILCIMFQFSALEFDTVGHWTMATDEAFYRINIWIFDDDFIYLNNHSRFSKGPLLVQVPYFNDY